jgi:hypothetical protein
MMEDRKPPVAECEWCGNPMKLWLYSQRFCCRSHSDAWHLAERRQALERFRAEGHQVETNRKAASA